MGENCERPKNAAMPIIWEEFIGKKSGNRKYRIQQITEEYHEEIMGYMANVFCADEPTSKYLGFCEDQECLSEAREVWKLCLLISTHSVVCLEVDENDGLTVAGSLLLYHSKESRELNPINEKWKKTVNIFKYIHQQADIHKTLQINNHLGELGLLVLPGFRGEGIADKLLYTCDKICKIYNYPCTVMTFSSYKSQNLGLKTGYTERYSISYRDLRQLDYEKYGIDNIEEHTKDIKVMYKAIK